MKRNGFPPGFTDHLRDVFSDEWFVGAAAMNDSISDRFKAPARAGAQTEHTDRPPSLHVLESHAHMPQRTTAGIDDSFHTDVNRQHDRDISFGHEEMPAGNLALWIKHRVGQGKSNMSVHDLPPLFSQRPPSPKNKSRSRGIEQDAAGHERHEQEGDADDLHRHELPYKQDQAQGAEQEHERIAMTEHGAGFGLAVHVSARNPPAWNMA